MKKKQLSKNSKKKEKKTKLHHCDICNETFKGSSYQFNAHKYKHNAVASRFKCSFCMKEFFRSDVYKKHIETHKGIKKRKVYVCDHCDRSFVDKRNLIVHLKIHHEFNLSYLVKNYKCPACDVSYCEERLLKYHVRKEHFNLQNNKDVVSKKLNETWLEPVKNSTICALITQIKHNVISIKKCKIDKTEALKQCYQNNDFHNYIKSVFASKDKTHYSKAICNYCSKEMLKKSLPSHIRERHLKLRKFKCKYCNVSFKRHYQLVNHMCGKVQVSKLK